MSFIISAQLLLCCL